MTRDRTYKRSYKVDITHGGVIRPDGSSTKELHSVSVEIIVVTDPTHDESFYNIVFNKDAITYRSLSTVTYGGSFFLVTK